MKRIPFFSFLALGLFAVSFAFQSCQKEDVQVATPGLSDNPASDRAITIYGVTVFSANNPSQLVTMDAATGLVQNSVQVYVLDQLGNPFFLNDLKGVCVVNDQVFVTTGFNAVDAYSNMLIKVNPATGQAGIISYSDIGTVSDIDYDVANDIIYGLSNNSNRLVKIEDTGSNWTNWTAIGNITNMGVYVAKGLSMVRDGGGDRIVLASTIASGGNTRMHSVGAGGGVATFLGTVNPISDLAAGHCGIGFDIDLGEMLINRNSNNGLGVNSFPWANVLPAASASVFWGGTGLNFEDLSSDIE